MRITGFDNLSSPSGGETYSVEFEGKAYVYETWASENASDATWYFEGTSLPSPWADRDDAFDLDLAFDGLVERFDHAFYKAWEAEIRPVLDSITDRAITLSNSDVICGRCKQLVRLGGHSLWVDITGGGGCDGSVHDPSATS